MLDGILHVNMFHYSKNPYIIYTLFLIARYFYDFCQCPKSTSQLAFRALSGASL